MGNYWIDIICPHLASFLLRSEIKWDINLRVNLIFFFIIESENNDNEFKREMS